MNTPNRIHRLPQNGNPQLPTNSNSQSLSNQNRRQVIAANPSQTQTQRPKLSPPPKECPPQSTKSSEPSFKWTNPDPFNTEGKNHSTRRTLASPARFYSDIDSVAPDSLAPFNFDLDTGIDSVAPDLLAPLDLHSGTDSVSPDSPAPSDSDINANANAPEVSIKQRIYNAIRAFGIEIKSRMRLESKSKREERKAREELRRKSIANGAARAKAEDAKMRAKLDVHYDEERRKNSNARRKAKEREIEMKAKEKRRKAQEKKQNDREKRERREEKEWGKM
ncbi:uncharacterized protein EAF01_000098 [Botrytis porri]|uniref:Uncharacterized protein n=1 Tax=Botrytis porri TaxID=87229 RepID=A0A4Z1KXN8_9HELO|nr:uncharacterized protein EAF01_000098 [Botrytis porri]KAF7913692.1 hypothetical protein EAF01_000098 [Botrytis porri]TGO89282.1 hypothetical protein BPOR_0116g00080 [Botrytis porri]